MELKYHQKTFELLNLQPRFSQEAGLRLESLKTEKGFAVPASISEWYSLENAIEILSQHSNDDHFIKVEDFGKLSYANEDLLAEGLLLFMIENQAVCEWAIKLNNSDDPPVFARDVDAKKWGLCAETFSTFVWTLAFDWSHFRQKGSYLLYANAEPIEESEISELQILFQEEPRTYVFPGKVTYRFSRQDKRIHIWQNPGQADWNISANSSQSLFELVQKIWNLSDLKDSLFAVDDFGEIVLNRLKK